MPSILSSFESSVLEGALSFVRAWEGSIDRPSTHGLSLEAISAISEITRSLVFMDDADIRGSVFDELLHRAGITQDPSSQAELNIAMLNFTLDGQQG